MKHAEAEDFTPMSPDERLAARRQLFAAYGADFPMPPERKPAPRLEFRNVEAGRLLPGLAAGGLASSALWVDTTLTDPQSFPYWPALSVLLGGEILWILLGTASIVALCWMRGFVRRRDCLWVGTGLVCFLPYVGVKIAYLIAPLAAYFRHAHGHIHNFSPVDIGVFTYALGGIVSAPTGTLGGWILWSVLYPHRHSDDSFERAERFRNPLTARVLLGLALACLLPGLVFGAFLVVGVHGRPKVIILIAWAASTELLALSIGMLLAILIRIRGAIGRAQCLWIGTGISLLLPLATSCAGIVIGYAARVTLDISGERTGIFFITSNLFVGYFLTPVGLVSGWLLWRIAFRGRQPAAQPLSVVFE